MTGSTAAKHSDTRRLQKMKSKRKQILVKKAHELSKLCKLKVNVVVYDEHSNVLQEFTSRPGFNSESIMMHKQRNKHLKVNSQDFGQRKFYPQENYIEEIPLTDYIKSFKNLRKSQPEHEEEEEAENDSMEMLSNERQNVTQMEVQNALGGDNKPISGALKLGPQPMLDIQENVQCIKSARDSVHQKTSTKASPYLNLEQLCLRETHPSEQPSQISASINPKNSSTENVCMLTQLVVAMTIVNEPSPQKSILKAASSASEALKRKSLILSIDITDDSPCPSTTGNDIGNI